MSAPERDARWRERLALDVVSCLAGSASPEESIRGILACLHAATGLAQAGLRLREGDDFPFYAFHGYSQEFIRDESSLLERGPGGELCLDAGGAPLLGCLCGRVLGGQIDPGEACFTTGGSFFTPSWKALAPRARELGVTRGRCLMIGSETHALIPLRRGAETIGLLHLADPRPHQLCREEVEFLEGLGASVGVALAHLQAEALRREVEASYRGVLENLGLGYALHEMRFDERGQPVDYVTLEVNGAFERILSTSREAVVGRRASELIPPEELAQWLARFERAVRSDAACTYEAFSPLNQKHFRGCVFAADRGRIDEAGQRRRRALFAVCFEDVSAQKRASVELAESRAELRLLSRSLQDAIEEERAQIARTLHDELGSGLVGMKLDARWIEDHLGEEAEPQLRSCARSLVESADALAAVSRRITSDLRPPILDHMGLPAAIEWLARGLERRTGIRCTLSLPGELPLDKDRVTALFRAAQEALTNVARHSGASEVAIALALAEDRVRLEVRDNGRGLRGASQDALGLVGMRERIEQRGGTLELRGDPRHGTCLTIELPLTPR